MGAAVVTAALGGIWLLPVSAAQADAGCQGPTISAEPFGIAPATPYSPPQETYRYTLTNCQGMQVSLLTYGATIQSITIPDSAGHMADVALGFATLNDYVNLDSPPPTSPQFGGPYFGETVGRYANRIANGKFPLNGTTYTVPVNNGPNSLDGGFVGFGSRPWQVPSPPVTTPSSASVTMTLVSPNGDEGSGLIPGTRVYEPNCATPSSPPTKCTGYPAQVTVSVTFTLDNANQVSIHYQAHNDDSKLSTVVNPTNDSYFNLAGEDSGSAENQLVQINANSFTPTDSTQIPTGAIAPVAGTPFDFTQPKPIAPSIEDCTQDPTSAGCSQLLIAHGFDHNWVLNAPTSATTGPDGLNLAARALDLASGRALTVWTDQRAVQFYTGNALTGTLVGISGHAYGQGQGYTFETQHFPDSPNQPNFPSTVLGAGQTFDSTTIFAFGQAPAITSGATAPFTVGQPGSFTITTAGLPAPAITDSGALPSGLRFTDNGDGTATISGTPAPGTQGADVLTVTATNNQGQPATQQLTVSVAPASINPTPAPIKPTPPSGCQDPTGAYNQGFNAGFNFGFNTGFNSGFSAGFRAGFQSGFTDGAVGAARSEPAIRAEAVPAECDPQFNQGFNTAFNVGFNSGFRRGFDPGFTSGFTSGFNDGFQARHHRASHHHHG